MRIISPDAVLVVVYDDHLALQCRLWQCPTIHLDQVASVYDLRAQALRHVREAHPADYQAWRERGVVFEGEGGANG